MHIIENEPMSRHTTFGVGGTASFFVRPKDAAEVKEALELAGERGLPYFVIGKGSNILFSDNGYNGVIIEIGEEMSDIENIDETTIRVGAGHSMASFAKKVSDMGLSGLEFAGGIPGNIGGAVFMNAGAYDGEIRDCLVSVSVTDEDGNVREIQASELELGYRKSIFHEPDNKMIILSALFRLKKAQAEECVGKLRGFNERRREKQPLEFPSAGSTFKRPEGYFAGKLIQDSDLAGYSIGGAQVSEKHCGFIINRGGATASDIYSLIVHVEKVVESKFGVKLEPEVRMVGEFS